MKKKKSIRVGHTKAFMWSVSILLILFILLGIYWAKLHEYVGFKRFVQFELEGCKEPMIVIPDTLNEIWDSADNTREKYVDLESGISLMIPKDWSVNSSCGTPVCIESPDLMFYPNGLVSGARISLTRYNKDELLPTISWEKKPTNLLSYAVSLLSCSYESINGQHAVKKIDKSKKDRVIHYVQTDTSNYVLIEEVWTPALKSLVKNVIASFKAIPLDPKWNGDTGPYKGVPSSVIPYKDVLFVDVDVHAQPSIQGEWKLKEGSKMNIVGYTFVAQKDELFYFQLIAPGSMNMLSDVRMELYSYGPTVVRRENSLEWRAPVTGRYFLVVQNESKEYMRRFWLQTRISR